MASCDISDYVTDCVDDYLGDYDWSEIETDIRQNIEADMGEETEQQLADFKETLKQVVLEKLNDVDIFNQLKQEFQRKLDIVKNGQELHQERIESLEVGDKLYDDFLNRCFFGRLKWLFFGV